MNIDLNYKTLDKNKVLEQLISNPHLSYAQIVKMFNVSTSAISHISRAAGMSRKPGPKGAK